MNMSGIHNKNIIFYSYFPHDQISRACLSELDAKPELNKQFIRICVHDPQNINKANPLVNLPDIIQKLLNKTPILAIAGFKKPVFAQEAYSWMKSSALNTEIANSLSDNSGLSAGNIDSGGIADDCCSLEQAGQGRSELFLNTEYNMGFSSGEGEIRKTYASIKEAGESRIVTYAEDNSKGQSKQEVNQRFEQLQHQRDADVPKPIQRVGGIEPMGASMSAPMTLPMHMPQIPQGMSGGGYQQAYSTMPTIPQAMYQPQPQYQMPSMPKYQEPYQSFPQKKSHKHKKYNH